jgi:hypothetical protein
VELFFHQHELDYVLMLLMKVLHVLIPVLGYSIDGIQLHPMLAMGTTSSAISSGNHPFQYLPPPF